jgi:two-component system, NarL family, response regulator NreC
MVSVSTKPGRHDISRPRLSPQKPEPAGEPRERGRHKIRVLLMESHAVVREGIRLIVNSQTDMEVLGECGNTAELLEMAEALTPDVAVFEVATSQKDADDLGTLKQAAHCIRTVGLSLYEDLEAMKRVMAAGASGYVLKRSAPEELTKAIRMVARGEVYVDPAMGSKLADVIAGRCDLGIAVQERDLSARETEVLRMLAWGFSHGEIAERISVSPRTVETYRNRLMAKLDFHKRSDLVRYAVRHGWLTEDGIP